MNVSYRWLRSLAPGIDRSPDEAAEHLAARGFPVEESRSLAEGLDGIVVARVDDVRAHPNADRLRLCDVEHGTGTTQVVCGADNVEAGGWYPFAPVGAVLPGGMAIRKVKLRGEVSEGMLCSERELGLGHGHEGLMTLAGENLEPGRPLVEALRLDDVRMDVEVTANRPDLLSHEGVARELSPDGDRGLQLPDLPGEEADVAQGIEELEIRMDPQEASGDGIAVRIDASDLCSRYLGLVVRGVRVAPSPPWLQARLRSVGARPINNVVDATNYVLLELGQPLHAFDLSRVRDNRIVVRRAGEGEAITTLDGQKRALSPDMLAICDARDPMAVAGVMGGLESEVTEDTTDVLLECALFTPGPIRSTRKALGLSTDASYRFERGVDPEGMVRALRRAARIILATAGGAVTGPIADCCPAPFSRPTATLRLRRAEQLLGVPFTGDEIRNLLEPLGFSVEAGDSGSFSVEVPGFRSYDVGREVDLIEEVARTHGYDRFPETSRPFRPSTVPDHPLFELEARLRAELGAEGLLEAQTPAFAPEGQGDVELANPVSAEEGHLRGRLLPGLVRRLEHNLTRGNRDVRLFEIGTVFHRRGGGELPREQTQLAIVLHGRRRPPHWSEEDAFFDLWGLKGLLDRVAGLVSGGAWEVRKDMGRDDGESDWVDPVAAFVIVDGTGARVGAGGRLRAGGADLPPWAGDVWTVETTLPATPLPAPDVTYDPLPVHPGVERDLALVVPGGLEVETVLSIVRREAGDDFRDVRVFDVYRDPKMPAGVRSVAVRLHFRAPGRTLTDREVDDAVGRVVRTLEEELDVGFRGRDG